DLGLGDKPMQSQTSWFGGSSVFFSLSFTQPGWRLRKPDMRQRQFRRDRNQLVEHILSEDLVNPFAVTRNRWRHQHCVGGRMQFEVFVRMRQRMMRDQGSDMR